MKAMGVGQMCLPSLDVQPKAFSCSQAPNAISQNATFVGFTLFFFCAGRKWTHTPCWSPDESKAIPRLALGQQPFVGRRAHVSAAQLCSPCRSLLGQKQKVAKKREREREIDGPLPGLYLIDGHSVS